VRAVVTNSGLRLPFGDGGNVWVLLAIVAGVTAVLVAMFS